MSIEKDNDFFEKKIYPISVDEARKRFIQDIKDIKSQFDFRNLQGVVWQKYFSYSFPSSTLPHEYEHARRHDSHSAGSHQPTDQSLWPGDVATERPYDVSANAVFSKILEHGFYSELLKKYKSSELI